MCSRALSAVYLGTALFGRLCFVVCRENLSHCGDVELVWIGRQYFIIAARMADRLRGQHNQIVTRWPRCVELRGWGHARGINHKVAVLFRAFPMFWR